LLFFPVLTLTGPPTGGRCQVSFHRNLSASAGPDSVEKRKKGNLLMFPVLTLTGAGHRNILKPDIPVRCTFKNLWLIYDYKHFAALPLVYERFHLLER